MDKANISTTVKTCILLTEDEFGNVRHLASVGLDIVKIARVLEKDVRLFKRDWKTPGTPVYEAYQIGVIETQSAINEKIKSNAEKGNLTAIQQFAKITEEQNLINLKEEIFNT